MSSSLPHIGFGTWVDVEGGEDPVVMKGIVEGAIDCGYRFFDTGYEYKTEGFVLEAINNKKLARNEVYLSSKHQSPLSIEGIRSFMQQSKLDYYDLYLLHIPPKTLKKDEFKEDLLKKWTTLDEYHRKGIATNIGVSNFYKYHWDTLIDICEKNSLSLPRYNELEIHPVCQEKEYVTFLQENHVNLIAHTPLGNLACNLLFENESVKQVADELKCTPAQAVLASTMARGISVIPRSTNVVHMKENLDALKYISQISETHFNTLSSVDLNNNLVDIAIDAKEHNDQLFGT